MTKEYSIPNNSIPPVHESPPICLHTNRASPARTHFDGTIARRYLDWSAAFTPLHVLRASPPRTKLDALDPRTLMRRKRRAPMAPARRACPARIWSLVIHWTLDIGHWSFTLPSVLALLLVGCAVGPNYKRPAVYTPPNFRGAAELTTNSLADLPWWDMFQDTNLQALIRVALSNNYNLRIAVARVEEARAITVQTRANFFPQLNYTGVISRGKNALGTSPFFENGLIENFLLVDGNVSWEIDLWGRLRRLNESARAQYLATDEARRNVMITLISQVAQAYFQLLALDQLLDIAHATTNSFGESLRIFSQRFQAGTVSELETSSAEAALDSAAATVPELERQIVVQENLINYLLGRDPGPVMRAHVSLEELSLPEVPAGLPSTLLERRPDIRQAEQNLHSFNAQVGVAIANFLPTLNLAGVFGQVSPTFPLFTSDMANAWSLAASLTGPLFQGGRLVGQYRQTKAQRTEAYWQYISTILTALQEVSNALVASQKYAAERVQQARAVAAYQVAVRTATQRYIVGQASYYEVLQWQQQLFPAENSLTQIELNQFLTIVQLYLALGGGWETELTSAAAKKP